MLTVEEVARRLGVSRRRVQALVQAGHLPAERLGRQWVVRAAALERAENMRVRQPGRPLESAGAWRKIRGVEEGAVRVSPRGMDALRRQVRKRAVVRRVYVHRSALPHLLSDPAAVLGGADAAIAAGAPLDAPEVRDLYVRLADMDRLRGGAGARDDSEGNVVLHAVPDHAWPFAPGEKRASLWVAWLDLADRLERGADLVSDRLVGGRVRA